MDLKASSIATFYWAVDFQFVENRGLEWTPNRVFRRDHFRHRIKNTDHPPATGSASSVLLGWLSTDFRPDFHSTDSARKSGRDFVVLHEATRQNFGHR